MRISFDKVAEKTQGFLCRVHPDLEFGGKAQYRIRVSKSIIQILIVFTFLTTYREYSRLMTFTLNFTFSFVTLINFVFDRIVNRLVLIENEYIFMALIRSRFCIQEAARFCLIPNQLIIPKVLWVAVDQIICEGMASSKNDRSFLFRDTFVFRPKFFHRDNYVPRTVRRCIRKIAKNKIHRSVRNLWKMT
ncbi:hypothetical protein LEP1GSC104_3532 [Leptospira interrogans str. UI 12621]|uniref:Uncharacterized protein n=1 Tax=Leptospira interrogans str. UI 12621 TaxID=1049937 RepID=A0A0F6HAT3_LEPIR|nr:hypothetical protein LEP1GSC104_3532 [Leptospira interrogans str. UI 12621]EMN78504.1 hypothetical protein LEP1GSC106_3041 [Leptospira interrogans serovar Grippotyphosa str. UI 12764]